MSRRSFRTALVIVVGSLLILGGVGVYLVKAAFSYADEKHDGPSDDVIVQIDRGMNFAQITKRLEQHDVIDKPRWFRLYGMRRGVTDKVRPGKYVLRGDMTPKDVLDILLQGVRDKTVNVRIPEGLHMLEVFELIHEKKVADKGELERLARDPAFLKKHGIEGETVDGYLFPSTYNFRVPTPPAKVIARLIKQHRVVWGKIRREKNREIAKLKAKLGWSDRDIIIMASIVEKEAVVDKERSRIAQVFINRLTSPRFKPHRLDTDPTIRYGCTIPLKKSAGCKKWDPSKRLRRAQLDDKDNAYNTYQHEGLPPGPIANPGEKSMRATADPDGSRYFYFVSRNDGPHVFARTRKDHERNVDKYQR